MYKVFIIAEVGINHNGDIEIAKKLIDAAKFAGANAVKFQKRDIYKVYSEDYLNTRRESPWGSWQKEQKMGLEFGKREYDIINEYCYQRDIEWFASAWDLESVKFLKQYNLIHNKIASPMLVHKELLHAIAEQRKLTFISTGMSTMQEIEEAINIFEQHKCRYELMHCNSAYPMPTKDANLKMIQTLKDRFGCRVGYSGHEVGLIIAVAARVLGATSIERHITLDRSMYGSDQASSVEPIGFYRLVQYIREVEVALGNGVKKITEIEEKAKATLQREKDIA